MQEFKQTVPETNKLQHVKRFAPHFLGDHHEATV